MDSNNPFSQSGTFDLSPDKQLLGELRIAGADSILYLYGTEFFETESLLGRSVNGTMHDRTKVTLIGCMPNADWSTERNGERYSYSRLFPHFVVHGHCHLPVDERVIQEVTLILEDASALFYDFDAFGSLIDARSHIAEIVNANKLDRRIELGEHPQIAYFTGKREIVKVATELGEVAAHHNPGWNVGGPNGVRIDNFISVTIRPSFDVEFAEAIKRMRYLLRFFELLVGRPQTPKQIWLQLAGDTAGAERLRVHWSLAPGLDQPQSHKETRPEPLDMLIDPISCKEEFSVALTRWVATDSERRDARSRFSSSFSKGTKYDIDRLIAAANMFDILPISAVPKDRDVTDDLREAQMHCRETFARLPAGIERDSVLSALGRIGKCTLKHKIRFRAKFVLDAVGDRFPDLLLVLDEAVNCRNHYVHGSESKLDYSRNFDMVIFFTETLEFVFAGSDLVESGWDIQRWCSAGSLMSHPFGRYRASYLPTLTVFKKNLSGPLKS